MATLKVIGKDTTSGQQKTYKAGDIVAPDLTMSPILVTAHNDGSALVAGRLPITYRVPYKCVITKVTLVTAGTSGTVTVDIRTCAFESYPSVSSICASAKPALSSAITYEDSTLTGWTTAMAAGTMVHFFIEASPTPTATEISMIVELKKTS